jgi:hypothetical protein
VVSDMISRADTQSMLSGLLKSFDDKPISQEKRATVNSKLDLGIEKFRGLKRKVSLYTYLLDYIVLMI